MPITTSNMIQTFHGSYSTIVALLSSQGYLGLIILMTLEGASLPIPSEVVIPVAGYLAAKGILNPYFAFIAILIGNTFGMAIDYAIGYFIGKEVVYKHLQFFRIKKKTLDSFDAWFARNGSFAVFVSRMIPEVRALMSFPAGFAKMPLKKFFFWSILGSAIWDVLLMAFGYYLLSANSAIIISFALAVFIIALYIVYRVFMKSVRKNKKSELPV